MKVGLTVCALLFSVACKKKEEAPPAPTPGSSAPTTGSSASADAATDPVPTPDAADAAQAGSGSAAGSAAAGSAAAVPGFAMGPVADAPPATTPSDLPVAQDVLPKDEAIGPSLVISGKGYRFQVPPESRPAQQDGETVYAGLNEDLVPPLSYVHWMTTEKFAGTVDELVEQQRKAATAAGATKVSDVKQKRGYLAGKNTNGMSRQFYFMSKDRGEMRTMTVQKGTAYILHCAAAADRFGGVMSDCGYKSEVMHINPPAMKKPSK